MPTYTYRCNDCGHEFDARQRMSDDPLTECPVCGGSLRRVVGSVGIVFKGKGFYVTDNRSNGRVQPSETTASAEKGEKPKKEEATSATSSSSSTSTKNE